MCESRHVRERWEHDLRASLQELAIFVGTARGLRAKGSINRPVETSQKFIHEYCREMESMV